MNNLQIINHPVVYYRDFRHDLPDIEPQPEGVWKKCQKVALAALPLVALHKPLRGPLTLTMSAIRTFTHATETIKQYIHGNFGEGSFHLLHAALSVAAVGLFFFNPVLSLIASSVSDLIINLRNLVERAKEGNMLGAMEALAFVALDMIFILSLCYGSIEITVLCMVLQIAMDGHLAIGHLIKGEYLEAGCQVLTGCAHVARAIPQVRILNWKIQNNFEFTAQLKQAENGFVYLDIPDEYVYTLYDLIDDPDAKLPPYFGKGRAGAHISVISADEVNAKGGFKLEDVGKTFTFSIVHTDSLKPDGWKGVDKVHFLTISCPELESFRIAHGFSPKMGDHDFHMTYGINKSA